MSKRGLLLVFSSILLIVLMCNLISAAENLTAIDNAYKCLKSKIDANKAGLSLQDKTFSIFALGDYSSLSAAIESDKNTEEGCWPKTSCTLKDTAQVLIAYTRINKEASAAKNWLLSKNITSTTLNWYLEIDTNRVAATCKLRYDGKEYTSNIGADGKLSGSSGNCFSTSTDGYSLRINNPCIGKTFEISCDQDFVTAVIYQRGSTGTTFVQGDAHSASASSITTESAKSMCFKSASGACEYEGSLWAVLALKTAKQDVSAYMPYLLAFADDNRKLFPYSFLYILTGGEDYSSQIAQLIKQNKFWEMVGTPYNQYYDTSLALLALSGMDVTATESYLLTKQGADGCWNNGNIRDTAFLLYSGWPRVAAQIGGGEKPLCKSPMHCEIESDCTDANGTVETSFLCSTAKVCCSVTVAQQNCAQKNGVLCNEQQECISPGIEERTPDGRCCVGGGCKNIVQPAYSCAGDKGSCKDSCETNEDVIIDTCAGTQLCCVAKKGGSKIWIWIILLIILIALVILGIVYRDKLRLWFIQVRDKLKKKPSPAMPMARPTPIRPMMMPQRPAPVYRAPQKTVGRDKEMEETLKKLKELSK